MKENKILDYYGQEILEGDYISYPVRTGSSMWLATMKVHKVQNKIKPAMVWNSEQREYILTDEIEQSILGYVVSNIFCYVESSTGGDTFVQEDFPAKFFRRGYINDDIIMSLNANGIKGCDIYYPVLTTVKKLNRVIKLPKNSIIEHKELLDQLKAQLIF
jgi:hypothetical protein